MLLAAQLIITYLQFVRAQGVMSCALEPSVVDIELGQPEGINVTSTFSGSCEGYETHYWFLEPCGNIFAQSDPQRCGNVRAELINNDVLCGSSGELSGTSTIMVTIPDNPQIETPLYIEFVIPGRNSCNATFINSLCAIKPQSENSELDLIVGQEATINCTYACTVLQYDTLHWPITVERSRPSDNISYRYPPENRCRDRHISWETTGVVLTPLSPGTVSFECVVAYKNQSETCKRNVTLRISQGAETTTVSPALGPTTGSLTLPSTITAVPTRAPATASAGHLTADYQVNFLCLFASCFLLFVLHLYFEWD